ncbi:molybdopterin-guanine dinucleotide biosynthesis protein B [Salibacterium halotolerans]|nr:molybdopterin-guanine dinucleotide biosynthesis protein MobB [Salibacterium halotolerans]
MEKLIQRAARSGMKTAALKHHGHTGNLKRPDSHPKDSMRHKQAGAFLAAASGSGQLQLEVDTSPDLQELLTFYRYFNPDIIFVEGYKQEHYPKVVLLQSIRDISLLRECSNVTCAVTSISLQEKIDVPCFFRSDDKHYLDFILNEMEVADDNGSLRNHKPTDFC